MLFQGVGAPHSAEWGAPEVAAVPGVQAGSLPGEAQPKIGLWESRLPSGYSADYLGLV